MLEKLQRLTEQKKVTKALAIITLLTLFLAYGLIRENYRELHIDSVYYLSYYYNYLHKSIEFDYTFCTKDMIYGMSGVQFFGKTSAHIYGTLLDLMGWTKANSVKISTLCILLTGLLWVPIAKKLGFSKSGAYTLSAILLLSEPLARAGHLARPEALILLLISIALYLVLNGRYFIPGLLAAIAIEIQPMGIFTLAFISAAMIGRHLTNEEKITQKNIFLLAAGLALGVLYYIKLHTNTLVHIPELFSQNTNYNVLKENIFSAYFWVNKYSIRHIPTLVLMAIGLWGYLKKSEIKKNPLPFLFLIIPLLTIMILKRDNGYYFPYIFIGFAMVITAAAEKYNLKNLLLIALLAGMIPQYLFLYNISQNSTVTKTINTLRETAPKTTTAIYGPPNAWYALYDRNFHVLYEYDKIINNSIDRPAFKKFQSATEAIVIITPKISPKLSPHIKESFQVIKTDEF